MGTCKSPRMVMKTACAPALESLPRHSSKFSRKDFTPAQLFACLAVKDQLQCGYRGGFAFRRGAEVLPRDSPGWLADIAMTKAPGHNTLCRRTSWHAGTWG